MVLSKKTFNDARSFASRCTDMPRQVAIKWCTACDDPFCGPCWSVIHSRGKRSLHSHCTVSPGGRVSTKAIAPDGTDAGPFTPGESLRAETSAGDGNPDTAIAYSAGCASLVAADTPATVSCDVTEGACNMYVGLGGNSARSPFEGSSFRSFAFEYNKLPCRHLICSVDRPVGVDVFMDPVIVNATTSRTFHGAYRSVCHDIAVSWSPR